MKKLNKKSFDLMDSIEAFANDCGCPNCAGNDRDIDNGLDAPPQALREREMSYYPCW